MVMVRLPVFALIPGFVVFVSLICLRMTESKTKPALIDLMLVCQVLPVALCTDSERFVLKSAFR